MADATITIRGITPGSNTPPGGSGTGRGTGPVTLTSHDATAAGDYLLVLASVDFVSSLTIDASAGVDDWTQVAAANSGNTMRITAWLGRVNTGGARQITCRQGSGGSGLHVQLWTLDASGAAVTRDGGTTTVTGGDRPYTLPGITTAGDRSLLVAGHAAVQFTSANLDYSDPPAGMTAGCEQYFNQYSGQITCYERLADPGAAGDRELTSNIPSLSGGGGAGVLFALRAEPTSTQAPTSPGQVTVRGPAPDVYDPTVVAASRPGQVTVSGPPSKTVTTVIPDPGPVTVSGAAPGLADVLRPKPGVVTVTGPQPFAGGTGTTPGRITVTGPPALIGFAGGLAPAQGFVPPIPEAPPTRVIAQRILTGEFLHWELPVDELEITRTLSGPQQITGKFPTEIGDLRDLDLEAWATWIHVEEDGLIRASGILQPSSIDENETLTLDAVGVSGYAKGIPYLGDFTLSGTDPDTGESGIGVGLDPADIVRDIWAYLQSFGNSDLGVEVYGDTPIKRGTPPKDVEFEATDGDTGQAQDVSFVAGPYSALDWWEAKDCGSEIDSLAKDTPFDFVEREAWNADKTAVDHWIELTYPRRGGFLDGVRFAQDENIMAAVGPEEPDDRYASEVVTLGKGEGSARVRGFAGRTLGSRLRRVAVVDDKTIESTNGANSAARVELESRQALADITEALVLARHPNGNLGSYTEGDEVVVEAEVPWIGDLRVVQRILSYTYSPTAETVKLGLRSASSFTT